MKEKRGSLSQMEISEILQKGLTKRKQQSQQKTVTKLARSNSVTQETTAEAEETRGASTKKNNSTDDILDELKKQNEELRKQNQEQKELINTLLNRLSDMDQAAAGSSKAPPTYDREFPAIPSAPSNGTHQPKAPPSQQKEAPTTPETRAATQSRPSTQVRNSPSPHNYTRPKRAKHDPANPP